MRKIDIFVNISPPEHGTESEYAQGHSPCRIERSLKFVWSLSNYAGDFQIIIAENTSKF